MWESDDSQPWSWRSARWLVNKRCYQKPVSSTSTSQPPGDEKQEHPPTHHSDAHGDKAFRAFVDCVDREVARDPYGILFGKRLESPPSANNSSWTSFSWIFEPKAPGSKEATGKTSQEPLSTHQAPQSTEGAPVTTNPSTSRSEISIPRSSTANAQEEYEYEYDPITMRNVSKSKKNTESAPEQPLLQSLFSEHGVNIPVKTYKPHKVFGYGSNPTSKAPSQTEVSETPKSQFESSRKSELSTLLTRAKGNNLDTTARFTDVPLEHDTEVASGKPEVKPQPRHSTEPDDNVPLFSGTTYAARSLPAGSSPTPTPDWLSKERFRTAGESSMKMQETDDKGMRISDQKVESTLEPALDPMTVPVAENVPESASARLEPSIDRHIERTLKTERTRLEGSQDETLLDRASEDDIDLLRASDVRASMRSARVSKQQLEQSKCKTRSDLESDFAKHQAGGNEADNLVSNANTTRQISKSLANIWNHIKVYPSGIVARTMQSMNTFNHDYKKYVKPSNTSNLTEKLVFEDESLSKTPSIYRLPKTNRSDPLPTSPDVEKEEAVRSERFERLRAASEEVKKDNEIVNAQLARLAADIKVIYEEECGPIESRINGSVRDSVTSHGNPEMMVDTTKKRIGEDSEGKGGVQGKGPDGHTIENGSLSSVVEHDKSAKLRAVIDGTKELRRELHEAGMAIRAIESGRPQTVWNTPTASSTNFGKKRMELTDRRVAVKKAEGEYRMRTQPNVSEDESTKRSLSTPTQEELPQKVPAPVFTASQSPIWNDEQPPPIEELREKSLESTYVVLAQNRSTGKIEMSPLNNVPISSNKLLSPILALSRLHQASDYLVHFERLEKSGYELYTGSKNMLIFRKRRPDDARETSTAPTTSPSAPPTSLVTDGLSPSQRAATVLDEIPSEVDPPPGPAAPLAPPSHPSKQSEQQALKSRVRRQEQVFSGTMRPGEDSTQEIADEDNFPPHELRGGLWHKFTRGVKRAVLTLVALGGVAYAIGFVAEGIGAQTQLQNGIVDGQVQGPRKRIVMTGQRPGIYSTESSR